MSLIGEDFNAHLGKQKSKHHQHFGTSKYLCLYSFCFLCLLVCFISFVIRKTKSDLIIFGKNFTWKNNYTELLIIKQLDFMVIVVINIMFAMNMERKQL